MLFNVCNSFVLIFYRYMSLRTITFSSVWLKKPTITNINYLIFKWLPTGISISQAILNSVTSSKRTILVVSNAFAKSQWCRWETQLAEFNNLYFRHDNIDSPDDTLLVIKLEKLDKKCITPTLKYLLKTRIYLEWSDDREKQKEFWNKIRTTLSTPKPKLWIWNKIALIYKNYILIICMF